MLKYNFLIICLLLFTSLLFANTSLLEKKVTVYSKTKTVLDILHEIEEIADLTFSFKSDIFDRNKKVIFNEKERTIKEILDIIFTEEDIQYQEIGNQILLILNKKEETKEENNINSEVATIKVINDTVFRYINTTKVKVYDSVRYVFFDTIRPKIEKPSPDISFEFGISPYYNFSKIIPQYSENEYFSELIKSAEKPLLSYQVYLKLNKSFNWLKLSTGITYSFEKIKANYNIDEIYTKTVNETLQSWNTKLDTSYREVYNTGMGGKPDSIVWKYIYKRFPVDSFVTYTKSDSIQISSSTINKYHYLQFPITIGWQKYITDKLLLSINTGPSIDLLISKKGKVLNSEPEIQLYDVNDIPYIKINTSWLINVGISYKFKPQLAGSFQFSYNQQLQSAYSSNFTIKKIPRKIIFSLGCIYYL